MAVIACEDITTIRAERNRRGEGQEGASTCSEQAENSYPSKQTYKEYGLASDTTRLSLL